MTSGSRQFHRSRNVLTALGIGAAGVVLAACGATAPNGSGSIPSLPGGSLSTPSGAVGPTPGNLGDTLSMVDSGADTAHVTLIQVFDPATGYDPNNTPPDGTRWVGFEGTIVVDGSRAGETQRSLTSSGPTVRRMAQTPHTRSPISMDAPLPRARSSRDRRRRSAARSACLPA